MPHIFTLIADTYSSNAVSCYVCMYVFILLVIPSTCISVYISYNPHRYHYPRDYSTMIPRFIFITIIIVILLSLIS